MVRTCTGEVWVRSSRLPNAGSPGATPAGPLATAPLAGSVAPAPLAGSPAPAPHAVRSSMKKVSSSERAGWSAGVFSAVKL